VGVSAIEPIVSERSLVSLSTLNRGHAVDRWHRVAISSAKQCGRAHLPVIHQPRSFLDWLATPVDGQRLLLVEPAHTAKGDWHLANGVSCIVGPEGGWADAEVEAAIAAGCTPVTLGSMTLRADAAGLIAVSIVSFLLENR